MVCETKKVMAMVCETKKVMATLTLGEGPGSWRRGRGSTCDPLQKSCCRAAGTGDRRISMPGLYRLGSRARCQGGYHTWGLSRRRRSTLRPDRKPRLHRTVSAYSYPDDIHAT